jgi:opacity protein-like surface antigen
VDAGDTEMVMMNRVKGVPIAFAAAALMLAGASSAQAQVRQVDTGRQAIGFNLGYFAVKGEDSRVDDDVLVADLSSAEALAFDIKDFSGWNVGGEWLIGMGDYLEAGVGVNFYQRTVPSVYADFEHPDGSEIAQDLKLRIIPISATVRFLPIGRAGVTPYVGGGIGIFNWRYSEAGEFVDTRDFSTFRNQYVADGTSVGPVILGGVRFPIGDLWTLGGEIRWQKAEGKGLLDSELLGDKIDLGGVTAAFTFHLRF